MAHPLQHPDPDVGCRWMCEAIHSAGDDEVMRDVLESLPFRASPLPPSPCPVNTWDID